MRKVRAASEHKWLKQYVSFLSIPNVADDENNIARNAAVIMELMRERNIGNDQQVQQQRVVDPIKTQGFYVTAHEPTDAERAQYPKIARVIKQEGYNAQRTPMDLPIAKDVAAAVRKTTAGNLILVPSLGGSLPLFLFEKFLKVNTITVPLANHDNNQHAENENIRLQNFWNGIETMAAIMMIK
ncbi:MAG TPA: hypothetical protein VJ552_07250 [Sediminibacterium sp.]|nr:hypothetical protein [Sediminibacterium sp.]